MTIDRAVLVTHPKAHLHIAPYPKPNLEAFEAPLRTQMIEHYLAKQRMLELEKIKAQRATQEEILSIHSSYLIDSVKVMSQLGGGNVGEAAQASPDLYRNALISAGGAITAARASFEQSAVHAFSLLRPPGHHATKSTPSGLCFFNNVAIAIGTLRRDTDVKRISIFDFDNHFGNGTAEIFYADPGVQYISIHEYDYENFGLGHYLETGFGEGQGTNINIPLLDGASDRVYAKAMERLVIPSLEAFEPEVIAISAGFDPHYADPVGNMNVDSGTFWRIGREIGNLTTRIEVRGSFSVLEGGYNPLANGPSTLAYLMGLLGMKKPRLEDYVERESYEHLDNANLEIIETIAEEVDM